jgi:hypothetical protein
MNFQLGCKHFFPTGEYVVCWLKAVSYQQLKLAALVCFAFIPSKILFVSAEAFDTEKQFCVIFFSVFRSFSQKTGFQDSKSKLFGNRFELMSFSAEKVK